MKFTLLIASLILLSATACQPIKENPDDTSEKELACAKTGLCKPESGMIDKTPYTKCNKPVPANLTLNNRWYAIYEYADTHSEKIVLQFFDNFLSRTNFCTYLNDTPSPASVGANISQSSTNKTFSILNRDRIVKDTRYPNSYVLSCESALEQKSYSYSFQGECLVIKPDDEPQTQLRFVKE